MTDDDTTDRLDRLESLVERQAAAIEALREDVAALGGDRDDGSGRDAPISRRTAMKAGGLLALLGIGAGTASADPQGQVGTATDPLHALYSLEANSPSSFSVSTGQLRALELGVPGTDGEGNTAGGNVVAGHPTNVVENGAAGATIGGGGSDDPADVDPAGLNRVYDHYATVTGGEGNQAGSDDGDPSTATHAVVGGDSNVANGPWSVVSGGQLSRASGESSTIGGGNGNTASGRESTVAGGKINEASNTHATVGGGSGNTASAGRATVSGGIGNAASGLNATVGGGESNTASASDATVGGGVGNTASGLNTTVGGGELNTASERQATVGGGVGNTASGIEATVGGGRNNTASGFGTTVGGGESNSASVSHATVGGGLSNTASELTATVGGGDNNTASGQGATVTGGSSNTASDNGATVAGGTANTASGVHSFAAGRQAKTESSHGTAWAGAFVWGDSSPHTVRAEISNQVVFQAGGGMMVYTDSDTSTNTGVALPAGSGSWTSLSSRTAKSDVQPVNGPDALEAVDSLDIATWRYDGEDEGVRHMGPMAEDFYDAFGLGHDEQRISTVDADGVALAAIQGLSQKLEERDERIDDLETTLERTRQRLRRLEATTGSGGPIDTEEGADV